VTIKTHFQTATADVVGGKKIARQLIIAGLPFFSFRFEPFNTNVYSTIPG